MAKLKLLDCSLAVGKSNINIKFHVHLLDLVLDIMANSSINCLITPTLPNSYFKLLFISFHTVLLKRVAWMGF